MRRPKWFVLARNEYRVRTSWLGGFRPYFLYVVGALLAAYLLYLAPALVDLMINDLLAAFLSQAAAPLTQILLFMFFFLLLTFPISTALQEAQTGQLETLLAAPVRPGTIVLGEYLGMMPFYAIVITVVTGFFLAILQPLGLGLAQVVIVLLIFVITLLSALWIGVVIGGWVRSKLGRTAHGRDLGRALALLIVLPPLAVFYAILGGGLLEVLANPATGGTVSALLVVFPSSWGARLFVEFIAHPGDLGAVWFETVLWFGGLVLFFAASLWVGARVANRTYRLELLSFSAPTARREGVLYGILRRLGGGRSFASLLVSIFKEYGRRVENLSWIAYAVGLYAMMSIILLAPEEEIDALVPAVFLLPLLAAAVAGDVTLRGRENLLICRKAPRGEGRYLKAVLVKNFVVAIPVGVLIIVVSTALSAGASLGTVLVNAGFVAQLVAALTVFCTGLYLLVKIPGETAREKRMTMVVVFNIAMFASFGLFIASIEVLGGGFEAFVWMHAPGIWLFGLVALFLGQRRLRAME